LGCEFAAEGRSQSQAASSASRIRITIAMSGARDRRRRVNSVPSDGGFTRGSVVAFPQR
jgi:hypothetical protein